MRVRDKALNRKRLISALSLGGASVCGVILAIAIERGILSPSLKYVKTVGLAAGIIALIAGLIDSRCANAATTQDASDTEPENG